VQAWAMKIAYSTSVVRPEERVAYWREVVNENQARHDFHSCVGPSFDGSITAGALGGIGISLFECDPCEVNRTQRDLTHCQSDDVLLILQQAGRSIVSQDGREAVAEQGDLVLMDTGRPCGARHQSALSCIILSIPRPAFVARLGSARSLTARAISTSKPLAGLAAGFLRLLPERLDLIGEQEAKIADQAVDLIALAFSVEADQRGVTLSYPRAATLLRLKSAIETHLNNRELKPAMVAEQVGISVRYANALLSEEGFSLERYILHRRLERCRCALADVSQMHRTIGEIAFSWGFSDLSHFGRRFRKAYGCAPGDYRRHAANCRLEPL